MSSKPKFAKLQLRSTSRKVSETQISNFFISNSPTELNHTLDFDSPTSNTQESILEKESNIKNPTDDVSSDVESTINSCLNNNFGRKDSLVVSEVNLRKRRPLGSDNIKKFFNESNATNDFETPVKIKKTKILSNKRSKVAKKKNNSKQTKIKSAFLRNEERFAEYIRKQSLVEDVDPEELQVALTLSRSQIETCKSQEIENDIVDFRQELNKFQYKTNGKNEDYDLSLYMPGKSKNKWANKFTPLTMRNVEKQDEKINCKIDDFLTGQFLDDNKEHVANFAFFQLTSEFLLDFKSIQSIIEKHSCNCDHSNINDYYVGEMFEPTSTKIDHLQKDIRNIPGRDLSPQNLRPKVLSCSNPTEIIPSPVHSKHHEDQMLILDDSNEIKNTTNCSKLVKLKPFREASPDLFEESDCENSRDNISKQLEEDKSFDKTKSIVQNNCVSDIVPSKTDQNLEDRESPAVIHLKNISNGEVNSSKSGLVIDDEPIIDLTQDEEDDLNTRNEETQLPQTIQEDKLNFQNELKPSPPQKHLRTTDSAVIVSSFNTLKNRSNFSEETLNSRNENSIILSDEDEVNYSIRIANRQKTITDDKQSIDLTVSDSEHENSTSNIDCDKDFANVSLIQLLNYDVNELDNKKQIYEKSFFESGEYFLEENCFSKDKGRMYNAFDHNSKKVVLNDNDKDDESFDLLKLKAKYGIIDDPILTENNNSNLESTQSQNRNSFINKKTYSESFLTLNESIEIKQFKKFSSSRKFDAFIDNKFEVEANFSDFDEFDELVHRINPKWKKPQDFEKLITADINSTFDNDVEEFIKDEKTYLIRANNIAVKPDYERMDSLTILKELYKYGLKPLKRKQAIIMLEYIYNQSHPVIVDSDVSDEEIIESANLEKNCMENREKGKCSRPCFNFKDCMGTNLIVEDQMVPEVEKEDYIFPTNNRAKMSTAVLPFHIAWFNLVISNYELRESILHYEPIDLYEIYTFLKSIGYRYEPKEMKTFFDKRCIIFRYDLSKDTNNKHIRKHHRKISNNNL